MRSAEVLTTVIDTPRVPEGNIEADRLLFGALYRCLTVARDHDVNNSDPNKAYFQVIDPLENANADPEATKGEIAEAEALPIHFGTPRSGHWAAGSIRAPLVEGEIDRKTGAWKIALGPNGHAQSDFTLGVMTGVPHVIFSSTGMVQGAQHISQESARHNPPFNLSTEQKGLLLGILEGVERKVMNPFA